jgi:hypothetical protein
MKQIDLLGRLMPSIPEVKDMLGKVREKYDLPEVLPENEQLAKLLLSSEFYDWEVIRRDIEIELRKWFQPVSSDFDNMVLLFKTAIDRSSDIKNFLMSETIGVTEPEAARFIEVVNKNAVSGLTMLNQFFTVGSEKLLDHLITGRPITLPKEWVNPVLSITLPPGEKLIIAVAHQLSNPDELTEKFRQRIVDEFGEKPKIKDSDLDTAEYLAKKNTGRSYDDLVAIYLDRNPNEIPYKKGTKKYDDAVKKLKARMRQNNHRLQQDINQILGGDKK